MNDVLRKLLERNNLVEKDGEWYYPPYSTNSWIVVTTEDGIRFVNGFNLTKDNKINDYGFSMQCQLTDYKFIDRRVKQLIKEFNYLTRELKEKKVQEKLDNIRQDF